MSNVFISYSRKDSTKVLELTELLRSNGISVWIDQHAIEAASSWSNEIVQAIDNCNIFLLLISSSSITSDNVLRELSLAFESKKSILPVDIGNVQLPTQFRFQLAGIQRAPFEDKPSILRALAKLGIVGDKTKEGVHSSVLDTQNSIVSSVKDNRKSLMVLPFEDLSPDQDNGWFADGLTSELISSLSNIRLLRVFDRQTSMSFKGFRGQTMEIAKELDVRYFLEGSVRKFGEQIKISVDLLDISEGEHLWAVTHKGKFLDIFKIQETVAKKVVKGLKLKLTKEEEKNLIDKGTQNSEAYELFLRGIEYFGRRTKTGFQHAVDLFTKALNLDPNYAEAYRSKALILSALYRHYERNPEYLKEAETLALKARQLKPELWNVYDSLSHIYLQQNRMSEAEEMALEFVKCAPKDFLSHYSLGFYYDQTDQPEKAILSYQEALKIKPDARMTNWNLILVLNQAERKEESEVWSKKALPHYQRWIRLHPDDLNSQVILANLFVYAGHSEEGLALLSELAQRKDLDGIGFYNIAGLYSYLKEYSKSLAALDNAIDAGYSNIEALRTDPNIEPLRSMEEFAKLIKKLESKTLHSTSKTSTA